jgi:adenylate kinase family enzyme
MFLEVEIEKIITSSAIENTSSWKLMEKLGFEKVDKTLMIKYTFLDEKIKNQVYELDKNMFLKELFRKEKLHIEIDIDKEPYMRHISDDLVLNITGESGSGKSTLAMQYKDDPNCIIIDTDLVFGNDKKDKYNLELSNYIKEKYGEIDTIKDFDIFYKATLEYFKNSNKLIIIDSAQLRYLKDLSLLKGDLIVLRTCINTCYERCINRFKENNKDASYDEIAAFSSRKKGMYSWYHNLNKFLDKVDKID